MSYPGYSSIFNHKKSLESLPDLFKMKTILLFKILLKLFTSSHLILFRSCWLHVLSLEYRKIQFWLWNNVIGSNRHGYTCTCQLAKSNKWASLKKQILMILNVRHKYQSNLKGYIIFVLLIRKTTCEELKVS